jgi:hypothetical protein
MTRMRRGPGVSESEVYYEQKWSGEAGTGRDEMDSMEDVQTSKPTEMSE